MGPRVTETPDPATQKTQLAEDRTLLANERTFAGWMRTGLAAIGVGVGFSALFQAIQPPWIPRAIATAFLLLGAGIIYSAQRRACAVIAKMHAHYVKATRPINRILIGWVTMVATAGLVAAIWLAPQH